MASGKAATWEAGTTAGDGRGILGIHAWGGCQEVKFSLGWMARLNPEQLAFVGLLVKHRGNIQKLAVELNVAYNTARNHLDDIVDALEKPPQRKDRPSRLDILSRLSAGEISYENVMRLLKD